MGAIYTSTCSNFQFNVGAENWVGARQHVLHSYEDSQVDVDLQEAAGHEPPKTSKHETSFEIHLPIVKAAVASCLMLGANTV